MQMEEASEHRPGDYGRWESSLWSPWHRRQTFWASLFFPSAVVALSLSLIPPASRPLTRPSVSLALCLPVRTGS